MKTKNKKQHILRRQVAYVMCSMAILFLFVLNLRQFRFLVRLIVEKLIFLPLKQLVSLETSSKASTSLRSRRQSL